MVKQQKTAKISGVAGARAGGKSGPPRLLTGKFLLMYREKRGKENIENVAERKENNVKRKGGKLKEKLKMEGGKSEKNRRGPFLFIFFFFFFCFSLFKTTEICFRSTKMGIFYPGKSISPVA